MLHEIFPHRLNNSFIEEHEIKDVDYIFHFYNNSLLLKLVGDKFEIPRKKEISEITDKTKFNFLFSFNDVSSFIIWDCPEVVNSQYTYKEISFFRTLAQNEVAWICLVGFQLMNWYLHNKFCGKCGSETIHKTNERAISCDHCNTTVYPKISPAIIVAIVSKNKILLAHNSNFMVNWYSLVAGYADIGESLEETVIREVKEEVGLDVKNIRYYKSQPWPYSGSMMIGFIAEGDENQKITVDNIEITDAAWYSRGSLPNYPPNLSIAGEMIELFEKGKL